MVSAWYNFLSILLMTEFIIGILGNGFIALVNCIDWLKKQKLSSADRILTALAISRICLIWAIMSWCAKDFYSCSHMNKKEIVLIIPGLMASHFSNWLATGLSFFYFLKIANFSNPVFLCLKHRVDRAVLLILLGSLVLLPLNLTMISMYINIQTHPYERNMTLSSERSYTENFSRLIIFTVGTIIPFSISLKCFILLIFSLWKHLKHMKHTATGLGDPRLKAHIRAMTSVISFLLLFAVYFLSFIMVVFHSDAMQNKLGLLFGQVIVDLYPAVHSFILILGNRKLRKASLSVWGQLKRCGKLGNLW